MYTARLLRHYNIHDHALSRPETEPRLSLLPTCLTALGGLDPTWRKRIHLGGREGGSGEGGREAGREGKGRKGGGEGGEREGGGREGGREAGRVGEGRN